MGRTPWAAYLWPGLPQLWRQGSWSALVVAVGAAGLLNVALASSLVWSELLPEQIRIGAWMAVAVLWAGSAAFSRLGNRLGTSQQESPPSDDAYVEATEHYLKGNWFEAECRLHELLRHDARDLEAGLMLATLLRHTARLGEAARQLDRLECLDGWERWAMEIARERAYLTEATRAEGKGASTPGEHTEGQDLAAGEDTGGAATENSKRETGDSTQAPQQWTATSHPQSGDHADAA